MSKICDVCGLPEELCVCEEIAREVQGQIELQGDHKVRVKEVLSDLGFSSDTIEIRESKKNNKKRR